jgi:O-antigen/teichoic acid export membrane protein
MIQALHVMVNRLAVPVAALALLVLIGRESARLLGEYALVMSFYYIMQTLPLLGLTGFVLREVARRPDAARAWFTTIGLLAVAACAAIGLMAEAVLALVGYDPALAGAIRIVAASIVPGILVFLAELILIGLGRAGAVGWMAVAENAARLLASAWVLQVGGGIEALIWVLFAGRMAAFLIYLGLLVRLGLPPAGRVPDPAILRATWAVLPAFLSAGTLTVIAARADFIALSVAAPIEQVGYYGIAYRAFEIGMLAAAAVQTSLFPGLARAWPQRGDGPCAAFAAQAQRAAFAAQARRILSLLLGVALCAALIGAGWAPVAIGWVFPLEYPHPNLAAQLFCLLLVPGLVDQFLGGLLTAADRQARDARALAWGAVALLAGLVVLVPPLHLTGAWLAMLLGVSVQGAIRLGAVHALIGPLIPAREARRWLAAVLPVAGLAVAGLAVAGLAGLAATAGELAGALWLTLLGGVVLPAALLLGGAVPAATLRGLLRREKPVDSRCAS